MISFIYKLPPYTHIGVVLMFNSETEKKIINFIKKSPIGVTSSEIAKFLGFNRMTITKYLAIIKEKALIDFRQFGMAKLWYIPVSLNKETFLRETITNFASNLDDKEGKSIINKIGLNLGKNIDEIYRAFYKVDKLTFERFIDVVIDAGNKIGGNFCLDKNEGIKLIFRTKTCPFGKTVLSCPNLCLISTNWLGALAARNFGYAKIITTQQIAKGYHECLFTVYLRKTKLSNEQQGKEFYEARK